MHILWETLATSHCFLNSLKKHTHTLKIPNTAYRILNVRMELGCFHLSQRWAN